MKRTRKLVTVAVLAVAVVVSAITAAYALSANTTETYAYLPEHSVYFYDTAGEYAWASSEVDTLAVAGVIKGGGTHLFYPGNAITRADFIVMLDRAYGMSEALDNGQVNSNGSFVDVPSSAYYSKAVIAAKAFGIAPLLRRRAAWTSPTSRRSHSMTSVRWSCAWPRSAPART